MPFVTIVIGALLVGLGVWAKVSTGTESPTALIPAFIGGPLIILGVLALKESLLKHTMHAAATIGLLGFLAGAGKAIADLIKGKDLNTTAGQSVLLMTLLCAVFVALCVNSFIQVRRRKAAQQKQEQVG